MKQLSLYLTDGEYKELNERLLAAQNHLKNPRLSMNDFIVRSLKASFTLPIKEVVA